jgi:hypothetical protein
MEPVPRSGYQEGISQTSSRLIFQGCSNMADKRIPSSNKRTEIPLSPRGTPGGKKQTQDRKQPVATAPRLTSSPSGRPGLPVLPRLPKEEHSSSGDILGASASTVSTESTTRSEGGLESSGSGKAGSADGKEQKFSFREILREGYMEPDRPSKPTPKPTGGAQEKVGFYEFLRAESPPPSLASPRTKSKGKDSRKKDPPEKTSPDRKTPGGRHGLRRWVTMEPGQRQAAGTGSGTEGGRGNAGIGWQAARPEPDGNTDPQSRRPDARGHARTVSADVVQPASPRERTALPAAAATPRTLRTVRTRSLPEFTKEDQKRWIGEANGLASYESLFEFQIVMVKMAMATERACFSGWAEDRASTFGRDDKGCTFKGQAIENVYRPIAEGTLAALQSSRIGEEVSRQLSRLREEYPALRQSHIQAVEEMAKKALPAPPLGGSDTPNETVLAGYIEPVLLLIRGQHNSIHTSLLPSGMLQLAYALDYEVARFCLENKTIGFEQFRKFRKNMLISYLVTRGISKFLLSQPGKPDWARSLFSGALNKALNKNSEAFIESVLLGSFEKFPEFMKSKVYAMTGQAGMAANAMTSGSHSSDQEISMDESVIGNVKELDARLVRLPTQEMKRSIDLFVRQLKERHLPTGFLASFTEAMEALGRNALNLRAFSRYCLDMIDAFWTNQEKQGARVSKSQLEALLALEREWRAQLTERQAAPDASVKPRS